MNLKNCRECGRMFQANFIGQKLCQRCGQSEDDQFLKVREYIYDHPGSSVVDVSNSMEVEEELILKWLREGRLTLKGQGVGYPCDKCKELIQTGKYCAKCASKISQDLKAGFSDLESKQSSGAKKHGAGMWTSK